MKTLATKIATGQLLFGALSQSLANDSYISFNIKLDQLHKTTNDILVDQSKDKKEKVKLIHNLHKEALPDLYADLKENIIEESHKLSLIELDMMQHIDEGHKDVG